MAKPPIKPSVLTRKQLVGLERERYLNRLLLIGTGIIVLLVLGLVAYTLLLDAVIYPNQTVAIVEGTEIKGREFIIRAKFHRRFLVDSYVGTYQEYLSYQQIFGDDPTFQQQYFNSLFQISTQLDPLSSGDSAINQLVDEKLMMLEAEEMGIVVSEQEIEEELRSILAFFPEGTPTLEEFPTQAATSTLSSIQYALVSATPTASITPTPSTTPTPSSTPLALTQTAVATTQPSQTPSTTAFPTLAPQPSPSATLSPTPYTQQGYEQALAGFFESYESGLNVSQADMRAFIYATLLREAVKDEVTADLPRTQEQVWARHILVATEEEAIAALARLDAGEDWSALAAELSTDTSNNLSGGDLGWFPFETMVEPFANTAFALFVGETSEPIESEFGWHLIQVLGHEDRPLDQTAYDQLRDKAMTDFLAGLREKYSWQIFDGWHAMSPDEPEIPPQYQLQ